MSPRINVLEKQVAELIAAGEVVERPASVVKELVENAIDAGSTDITVEIVGGGVRMIRVSDNGCGIAPEDIPKAFLRHATSKVSKADDLDSILTLGFRGEALASVAAMCKVELLTKTKEALEATLYRLDDGKAFLEEAARPTGTTITVSDIFYNTPARMKFLKKDVAEGNAVAQVVDRCALSHPEIAFTFIRDGAKKLKTSGNSDLLAVIYAIHGREFAAEMQKVDYKFEDFAKVTGYISKPGAAKPSRSYQSFFINGRFVRTRTGSAALEEAYKNKIMHGRFPACFLNIELDAKTVDVNVHPAKIEVRFVNERPVFQSVYYAVKSALQKLETGFLGKAEKPPQPAIDEYISLVQEAADIVLPANPVKLVPTLNSTRVNIFCEPEYAVRNLPRETVSAKIIPEEPVKMNTNATNPAQNATITVDGSWRVVGELFKTYIIVEAADELVLVDKHAVHERILYEQLKASIAKGNRQTLLAPVTVSLPHEEHAALLEVAEKVEALGFLAEDFGGGAVIIREVPLELSDNDIALTIREIADKLTNHAHDLTPYVLDRLYYSIACRSALKAGDCSAPEELAEIVRQLNANPNVTHCPHGRPVSTRITRRELEKMFGRRGLT